LELVPSVASLREATPPHGCSRGEEFQSEEFQSEAFQSEEFQSEEFQSEEFQSEEFQSAPRRDRAFRHSGTPPRPSTARSGRWLAGEASETEGRSDRRVATIAQRSHSQPVRPPPLRPLAPRGERCRLRTVG